MKSIKLNKSDILLLDPKIFFLAIIFSVLTSSCNKDGTETEPLLGEAPGFSASTFDGNEIMLSDYSGKVVVLFFFGSNCPSCKASAPSIESMLVEPFESRRDYQVLGLDQWNGSSSAVEAFKSVTGVSFPLLLNAAGIAAEYQTTYDRLVVIDRDGQIVFSGIQIAANDISAVKEKVEMLLGSEDTKAGNAPLFSLKSLTGNEIKLSEYKDKVVVLFFFGYNCPSCKAVAPDVQASLVNPYSSRSDYQLLGLDQWNGNQTAVESFKTITGVTFPLLLSGAGVASEYKSTYDRLIVIDKNGNIAFSGKQVAAADIGDVKVKVDQLLAAL